MYDVPVVSSEDEESAHGIHILFEDGREGTFYMGNNKLSDVRPVANLKHYYIPGLVTI